MNGKTVDLFVLAERAVCPQTSLDGPVTIGVSDGLITMVEHGLKAVPDQQCLMRVRATDGVLFPGLVDLHTHPALSGSRFGVDPDVHLLKRGSTTVLSQGDAGARNLDEFIEGTINAVRTRVKLAINFCADGESNPAGRFFDIDQASIGECVAAIRRHRDHIWGISLNIAFIRNPSIDPLEVLRRGVAAADTAGVPIMFGATKNREVRLADQLKHLRPGDVMTYCFHSGDGSIVEHGRVLDCVWEARDRGVLFDVGDGTAAFGFDVAETAIREGFLPDTISSDFYLYHVESREPHDLPLVVSKLIAAGMTPEQCWPRVTAAPARVLGLTGEIGAIRAGAHADLTVLKPADEPQSLHDGHGAKRVGTLWQPVATFKGGELVSAT